MAWSKGGIWLGDGGWTTGAIASADAAQTTAFLARASGLSGTETAAYKALINGLVADGNFALLDALYILATNTAATAALNLISTSFSLTAVNAPTFTADAGYAGNGSNAYLDTGYIPTGSLNWKLGSSSLGLAIPTNDTAANTYGEIGTQSSGGSTADRLLPSYSLTTYASFGAATDTTTSATTSRGMWGGAQTSSTATAIYHNGSATPIASGSNTVTTLPNVSFTILGSNNGVGVNYASLRQVSAAWIGGGLTGAQYLQIANRINAYLTALGINVY
jgi:hypothetical protein